MIILGRARLAKLGDRIALTPNLSIGLMTSSGCGGDDADDEDDDLAFAGDEVTSSARADKGALAGCGIPSDPGVHLGAPGCSPPGGDGVDAVL